ncbi:hypothetical protein OIU77_009854 [Salix suchowensis]|uniref:DCL protein n=1 Tax=Salix suchowensis TaxID=1278906 RepID=A0ABQ9A6D0_9ROSI|nr:hypothetical protein OIU77_009854 [Salix suchowensis]
MAASALIRGAPLLRLRLQHHHRFATGLLVPLRRSWCSKEDSTRLEEDDVSVSNPAALSLRKAPKYSNILHSNRYMDGEQLTDEDEKIVAERLLAYHPNSDDKIGCGFDSIMPVHVLANVNVSIQTFYLEGVNLDKDRNEKGAQE